MKYEVTMRCGHKVTVDLWGKGELREREIARLERYGMCDECKKAKIAEETKAAVENGLPELEGSEKQILWALDIRKKYVEKANRIMELNTGKPSEEVAKKFCEWLIGHTEAHYWIDNRYMTTKEARIQWAEERMMHKEG